MGPAVDRAAARRLRHAVHDHILSPPNSRLLDRQLGDTSRTISDFGYSEVELVLCFYLKQLWIADPSGLSAPFFQRLGTPTWRSMKLLEAFLQCMKSNNASDFSLPTETHNAALSAFYNNGLKQTAQWVVNAVMFLSSSFDAAASQQQEQMLELSLTLLSETLSWPWPTPKEFRSVSKTGMSTDLITPDVTFEPIFIQESLLQQLQKIYFLKRRNSSLPQSLFGVLTLLGSYAPQSFASTRTHAQHLHRLVSFCLEVIAQPLLPAGEVTAEQVESDNREKMRVAVLLKTVLCTHAADVLVFLPAWQEVTRGVQGMLAVLYQVNAVLGIHPQDLLRIVNAPALAEDCVELQQAGEEVVCTVVDIISYWCDTPETLRTLGTLPQEVYALSLRTRLQLAAVVLRYSEAASEALWRDLEQRDENEDQWTFEEEQDAIGRLGRVSPGDSCALLLEAFKEVAGALAGARSEAETDYFEEQLYWLVTFIKHFVSDFDCDEVPLAFLELEHNSDYPLLHFMDCVNDMIKQTLSLPGVTISSTVLQSILGYLRKFVTLYLPFRPQLSDDFYVIVAITLASTSQENLPFKSAVEVLQLLLDQTFKHGVGAVNMTVWGEVVNALMDFVQRDHVNGSLQALNDMPVHHWRAFAACVTATYAPCLQTLFSTVLEQLTAVAALPDFADHVKTISNLQRLQALIALARGVCSQEDGAPCLPFAARLLELLPALYRQTRLHEELRGQLLKLLGDVATMLPRMTEAQSLSFLAALLEIIDLTAKAFPADDAALRKHSDFCVKTLSLLFGMLPSIITNSALADCLQWDAGLVRAYVRLLSLLLPQLTLFPLLMKTVFNASLMVCNTVIRGFDMASFEEMQLFLEFMLPSLERFDCEFKTMECLYLVYYHFAEARRGAIAFNQDPNVGLVSFIQNNPAVTERVFVASYKQIISPKTGCITKEGLETRASNLMLILIVTQREAIQAYFAQRYASILQKEPNLLAGVLSDKYVSGYTERHVRWSYNKVFLRFIQTIQKYEEAVSVLRVCQTKSGVTHN
ncbi:hypothetical protein BLSTO_05149 [Blastocystis sp. subtype 1]